MKVLPLSEVKSKLSKLVDVIDRRDEAITITRNGTAVAMIVSTHEYEGWHETTEDHAGRRAAARDQARHSWRRANAEALYGRRTDGPVTAPCPREHSRFRLRAGTSSGNCLRS